MKQDLPRKISPKFSKEELYEADLVIEAHGISSHRGYHFKRPRWAMRIIRSISGTASTIRSQSEYTSILETAQQVYPIVFLAPGLFFLAAFFVWIVAHL